MSAVIVVHGGAGEISDSRAAQKESNKFIYDRENVEIVIWININKNIQRTESYNHSIFISNTAESYSTSHHSRYRCNSKSIM